MQISGTTKIVGIFGYPVKHTLSPLMHNAAFSHLQMDYKYLPFEVLPENLGTALRALPALGISGVNLTIPHKESALEFLDEITPQAELIGAVNTVKVDKNRLIGYNTDGVGFVEALRREAGIEPENLRVCMLGAGGSARSVAVALAQAGIESLIILNRTASRAEILAAHINKHFPHVKVSWGSLDNEQAVKESGLIINTASAGMKESDELIIDPQLIQPESFVCDLIYNPLQTKLMKAAASRGARVSNGLGMLLYQGAQAFEIWTGIGAPLEVMRKEVIKKL